MRSELGSFPGRDTVRIQAALDCAHEVYAKAGITNPREQIDVAELYVPFSWYEPMWLEGHDIAPLGEGWKMTDSGETAIDGSFPVNPSGGVLSSNPIGASGMIRFGEAAMQVMGTAGDHQIDGARIALAQAYGGAAQYFAMWVVSSEQQPF
jgi:acetyl-CoA C-acetyltransferase